MVSTQSILTQSTSAQGHLLSQEEATAEEVYNSLITKSVEPYLYNPKSRELYLKDSLTHVVITLSKKGSKEFASLLIPIQIDDEAEVTKRWLAVQNEITQRTRPLSDSEKRELAQARYREKIETEQARFESMLANLKKQYPDYPSKATWKKPSIIQEYRAHSFLDEISLAQSMTLSF